MGWQGNPSADAGWRDDAISPLPVNAHAWPPALLFGSVVPVLVPVPLDGPFDYLLDDGHATAGRARSSPCRSPAAS